MSALPAERERADAGLQKPHRYAIVTPARNEADYIELTIRSMVSQTVRPLRWVIVSDGSTDGTDEIVLRHAAEHPWIRLVRTPERKERHFAGKVHAFNAGYAQLADLDYDIVGSMDADISFAPDYFEFLLGKFEHNPRLGLGGTPFREGEDSYDFRFASTEHVSGACQIFRRECFEAIGGYVPIKGGGIDVIAALSTRMKGWESRTFLEKHYQHHRVMGTAKHGFFKTRFKDGEKDYVLGGDPLWEVFRCGFQMTRKPYLINGLLIYAGYVWSALRRADRPMGMELVRFRRQWQRARLRNLVARAFRISREPDPSASSF